MPAAKEKQEHKFPLTALKGISDKRAALFADMGVYDQIDLLFFYPRGYENWADFTEIADIKNSGEYTFYAQIARAPRLNRKGKLSWLNVVLLAGNETVEATFFNQSWLMKEFHPGQKYIFHGKVEMRGYRRSIVNPAFVDPAKADSLGLLPIYSLRKGLNQKLIRQATAEVIASGLVAKLTDPVPAELRQKYGLSTLEFALAKIHESQNQHELHLAQTRLAFDEIYLMRAALETGQGVGAELKAPALRSTPEAAAGLDKLRRGLPFMLTRSQVEAINDVLRDLRKDKPMNRLLQGDVGSGKTMVALFAAAYTAYAGAQAVLMAPTSILAEQHWQTFQRYLLPQGLTCDLLVGATKARDRREILDRCASGECKVLIGTHALIQDEIKFHNLALTITDEQHRFGVKQRARLGSGAGDSNLVPHRLNMSATPIPRSLALIFFNDLELSVMRELPSGRKEVITRTIHSQALDKAYQVVRRELEAGGQAYVICPLIEESASLDLDSAEETYLKLKHNIFPDYQVAILHGQMKAEQKDAIMSAFVAGDISILVSTTVVEVGVDNPNATVMLVMSAERFGLAQLHQLRGRVGRGERQSYCFLVSEAQGDAARERLQALVQLSDGFALAEEDLRQRGPGDYLGTRQSGLPAFHFLDINEDQLLISQAKESLQIIQSWPVDQRNYWQQRQQQALAERYPDLSQSLN
ncbi:MAG: ATP-dependent DNA helicase RecG [Eubacteriales bacterium]|nr:ATP-dependent DNA helicase RecG [Eubacteriales bacterium]